MKNFSEFLESISSPLPPTIKVGGKLRSTINSDGEYIHSKIEDIKKFWEWFGDSKIVDDDGRPLVVYHGTREEIDKFHTDYSNAIYFSAHKNISSGYGDILIKGYISMKNPYEFNWDTYIDEQGNRWYWGEHQENIEKKRPEEINEEEDELIVQDYINITYAGVDEVKDDILRRGFDGAISDSGWNLKKLSPSGSAGGFEEIAVYFPEKQIQIISK